jgi:predicted dehydrogenase
MRTYQGIPDAQMVVCADINEEAAKKSAEEFGIAEWTTNFRDILARDDIDAVDVCLHNNFHMPATVAALEAGKHVYCEKPMAGAYIDAAKMLEVAKRVGKKLHIQLGTLYSDDALAAKQLIDDGELGEVFHARSVGFRRRGRPYVDGYGTPTFVQKRFSSGGALYDMGVYHIAMCLFLMGNPEVARISGKTYQKMAMYAKRLEISGYDVEELGLGFVRFKGDATLDIIESWALNLDKLDSPSIIGDKAGVKLFPFGFFKSYGNIDVNGTAGLGSMRYRMDNVDGTGAHYANSQAHWVAALQGKCDLWPTAQVALNTMLISEGIYLSDRLGREVTSDEVREASVSTSVAI